MTNTVTYNGNSGVSSVQLSTGNFVNANVPGDQLFLNAAGSVFGALQGLNAALQSGTNISAAVTQVQNAINTVGSQRVPYGNVLNQISQNENFLNQDKVNLSTQENTLVGVDPAKAATNFSQSLLSNQAVLAATSRFLNLPTLLDFLK